MSEPELNLERYLRDDISIDEIRTRIDAKIRIFCRIKFISLYAYVVGIVFMFE